MKHYTSNRNWERTPRTVRGAGRWAGLYVSLNRAGKLCMSRVTYERLGEPEAVLLLYERSTRVIGVEPTQLTEPDAFPVCPVTNKPSHVVHARQLLLESGINLDHGVSFPTASIDQDGVLILDLRESRRSKGPVKTPDSTTAQGSNRA